MRREQQALVDALLGRGEPPAGLRGGERGFAAYRHNLQALSAQALAVAYGGLQAQLGTDDFASLAWTFWRHCPPEDGDLGEWGGALADFLGERAGEVSGLPDLARLDWALHRAGRAADVALNADSLHLLGTTPPEHLWLRLRPGVALVAQRDGPVLVWRQGWRGQSRPVSKSEAAFMQALLDNVNLAAALDIHTVKGFGVEADFDFSAWLQAALLNAWLHEVRATPPNPTGTP